MEWMTADETDLVKRATFRPAGHHPVCQVVSQLQTEFARSGGYDGRARDRTRAHDHSALGSTVGPGIREAVEPVRPVGGRIVALRRDIYKCEGPVDISASCRR